MALKENAIDEVIVKGNNVIFKAIGSAEWFFSNASMLSKDQLFKIIAQNPGLKISCIEDRSAEMSQLMLLSGFGLAMYKALDNIQNKQIGTKKNGGIAKSLVKFSDIDGMADVKTQMQEIIEYIQDPKKFTDIGARLRRGVLLYGPPGTGKTLMAKAISGESGSKFLYRSASEFLEVYVGVGPSRVRQLFEEARSYESCIIFIDEIDAIGARAKNQMIDKGGNYELNATVNQLLVEMDGFAETDRIVVIAATNHELLLEKALIRSGRFDLKIKIELPNLEERRGIL